MHLTANTVRVRLAAEDWHSVYKQSPKDFPWYAYTDHLEESGHPDTDVVRGYDQPRDPLDQLDYIRQHRNTLNPHPGTSLRSGTYIVLTRPLTGTDRVLIAELDDYGRLFEYQHLSLVSNDPIEREWVARVEILRENVEKRNWSVIGIYNDPHQAIETANHLRAGFGSPYSYFLWDGKPTLAQTEQSEAPEGDAEDNGPQGGPSH